MKLSPIVLKLRLADTRFGNMIAGAAELDVALSGTLKQDTAFVIPLTDPATDISIMPTGVSQYITERFAVVAAIGNDSTNKDKTGITAYDNVHDVRAEIFRSIYGWMLEDAYDPIKYVGGKLLGFDRAYLWYQFEFEYRIEVSNYYDYENNNNSDGVGPNGEVLDKSAISDFKTIYVNYIMVPSADLPYTGYLPLQDGFPDVSLPDQAQWIDLTNNPDDGAFSRAFSTGFDIDKN